MKKKICSLLLSLLLLFETAAALPNSHKYINLKKEFSKTLILLSNNLIDNQIKNQDDKNFGAIQCKHCNVLHTRAGEGIFPLAISYEITSDAKYLKAAIELGDWLIAQQQIDGSWKETPEEWTGTTTDQLMMLAKTLPAIEKYLSNEKKIIWKSSLKKAANYLVKVMSPEFASINYCATTTASLSETFKVIADSTYLVKAKNLAHRIVSKMDEDGFIEGEGGRNFNNKYGVDLGYDLEMSLWGLGVYANNCNDRFVEKNVQKSLLNHLYFIYPDGSIDNSWGIRSNKWTTYGSATSDGSQITFMLYASEYPQFASAAYRNLKSIRENIFNGYLGYGPHYPLLFNIPPCIYPTFTKAKNLAMAYQISYDKELELKNIPSDSKDWLKHFKTLDVDLIRTKNYMATISNYRYKDYEKRDKSKYMFRPAGGSICNLWVEGYGFLQASSATQYFRWEPMSFPEVGKIISITPRIEFNDSNGYFTNLFEFDSRETSGKEKNNFFVSAAGELRDQKWLAGGVGYKLTHIFSDDRIEKRVELIYHDSQPEINIVEPIIISDGFAIKRIDDRSLVIKSNKKNFLFKVLEGNVNIITNKNLDSFWAPYPALKAFPIYLSVLKPLNDFKQLIRYQISIIDESNMNKLYQ
ncbi:MAG: hypothetical protein NTX65_13070 [Ignavibacteriales bacterium]|nr:hypothetical protein [Ignavibacteriales bacterium]